jgi:hypothetical protein
MDITNGSGGAQTAEQFAIDICRELYDRFVMGGWEPQDAHRQAIEMFNDATAELRAEIERLNERFNKLRDLAEHETNRAESAERERDDLRAELAERERTSK